MKYWGIAIPGLCMRGAELPPLPGLLRVDHPDLFGKIQTLGFYSIADMARVHANRLKEIRSELEEPFTVIGMSMGGMVASVLATEFRSELPKQTSFRLMVTSCNSSYYPTLPFAAMVRFLGLIPKTQTALLHFMPYLFSNNYSITHPERVRNYMNYLKTGQHGYSTLQLARQIHAIRTFKGEHYFKMLRDEECLLVGGEKDRLLGPKYDACIRKNHPTLRYYSLKDMGHMCNLEHPELFQRNFPY